MKLSELASVRSGLVLARKLSKGTTPYQYPLLNLRSVQQDGTIDFLTTDSYHAVEPLKPEYLSSPGDIVMRLTAPYTAVLIDESASNMVISSNFVVIRTEHRLLLPEYLFWLLNTQNIRHLIYENATSNMLGAVTARLLGELEIALLPMDAQEKIAQINGLARRESQLLKQLAAEKEKYCSLLLEQFYTYTKRGN